MTLPRQFQLGRPRLGAPKWVRLGRVSRARLALFAGALFAVLFVVVGNLLIDQFRPDAVDREYVHRLELLRDREAELPDSPLLLMVGSSRMVMGFAPERLAPLADPDGRPVLAFNFAHFGSGPVMDCILVNRLYRDGVRPHWVVLELMPGFFPRENARLVASLCTFDDVISCSRYLPPGELGWEFFRHRTAGFPAFAQRATRPEPNVTPYGPLGGYGLMKESVTPQERAFEMAGQANHFAWGMRDWKASKWADRAVRDSVAECRAHGANVWLVLSPEGGDHRKMYGPGGYDRVTAYMTQLAAELDVPFTDARDWLEESDFADSHHALRSGAEKFTDRLRTEVLVPLVSSGGLANHR